MSTRVLKSYWTPIWSHTNLHRVVGLRYAPLSDT